MISKQNQHKTVKFCGLVFNNMESTRKQQAAVRFCECVLDISFDGNIKDFNDCNIFLGIYLNDAKMLYEEIKCEYETYISR